MDWTHLRQYGYAPGDYTGKCWRCEQIIAGLDRRAVTCRPCAQALHDVALQQAVGVLLHRAARAHG